MLRAANVSDLDFIFQLIYEGAKEGYFNTQLYEIPEATRGFRIELTSILEIQKRIGGLRAYGSVYEHEGKRIGFLLMSAGTENKGNELWMAAIHPEFQNKGFGKTMIKDVLDQFKGKNLFLIARCSPKSEIMFRLLTNNGFRLCETGPEGTRGLVYQF